MKQKAYGFTIVELLIVIVVIAILAAISIVAYSGIQNNANDSAVKADLTNIAKQIEMDRIERGDLVLATMSALRGVGVKVSKNAYGDGFVNASGDWNLLYCGAGVDEKFGLIAWSKSGKGFAYVNGAIQDFLHEPSSRTVACPQVGQTSANSVWFKSSGIWGV